MIIAVIQNNLMLRNHIYVSGDMDYIIHDTKGNVLGNIVFSGGKIIFHSNKNIDVRSGNGEIVESIEVKEYSVILLINHITKEELQVYVYPEYIPNVAEFDVKKSLITVGKGNSNDLCYSSPYMKEHQYKLSYQDESWYLETIDGYVFVNDKLVKRKRIKHGDIIFSAGLKVFCIGRSIITANLLTGTVLTPSQDAFGPRQQATQQVKEESLTKEGDLEVFDPSTEFLRSPRFRSSNETVDLNLVPPPQFRDDKTRPALLTIGPRMTMMITSFYTMSQTLMNVAAGTADASSALPSIILSSITLVSSLMWPMLTKRYTAREKRKDRIRRTKEYRAYLNSKEKEIQEIIESQKQIMIENNVSLETCQDIIFGRRRNLWEKSINFEDFLSVRLGIGYVQPLINYGFNEEKFESDDSDLVVEVKDLIKKYKFIPDMPFETSLVDNRITAIIGNPGLLKSYFESLLLQLMTFHIYSELKIVIFTNEKNKSDWDFMKFSPYCWDNSHQYRLIASSIDDKKTLSQYIESVIKERIEYIGDKSGDDSTYKSFLPYFLIITDDIETSRNLEGINSVLNMSGNLGFSMIIKHNRIANLPSQVSTFIHVAEEMSGLFKNDLRKENQSQFKADFNKTVNVEECVKELANIYVNIPLSKHELPKSVGFLDMYGVGNVQQLNSLNRWQMNNPINSLSVPVGIDQQGELFNMDLHEKAYGPHGLVAGTTGSGKSEWIITYILSLCVNFSPEEVQFVLIDYKGGGLAGSFDNKETGMHLPHLVGTITNLDKSEIRRSLASLEAESKRRQQMFNEAREKLNDSSMNIYKYQQYYRKGMLDEPLSHLFLISDEFAELKTQEPEFLQQLVSIARIGRSLGIHLILATQKPAGVVDDQMWSNSRFKICLRVQDKADSKDMIKCDDAAYLKQTGAFYLQVGLNEYFALGQSAYAGGLYHPTSIVKKKIETAVELLNDMGEVLNQSDYVVQTATEEFKDVHGEELLNIILYVSELSKNQNFKIRPLWLDPIPEVIYVDNLKKKYGFSREPFVINPIIGEYDNPYQQKQSLLRLNLNEGNVVINGISGAGKEQLLQSMIYSIISCYTPQEVSLYICDFGAETLAMFADAPHVGGVVYQSDIDMIENTFRYANREYLSRRKKYREFGGTYDAYIKYGQGKDPYLVFIINNVDALKEILPEQMDNMVGVLKECTKYGITFVFSSIEQNALRGKLIDFVPQRLVMRQSDDDYTFFLGKPARGIKPKELKGRGVLNINGVAYEFEAATVCQEDKIQQVSKQVCKQLLDYYKFKSEEIPRIPSAITFDKIDKSKLSFNKVCFGFGKNTIEPKYFDLQKNFGTIVLAPKKFSLIEYVKVLYKEFDVISNKDDKRVYLFDPNDMLISERYDNITYVKSDEVANTFNNLLIYVNQEYEKYNALKNKADYKAPRRSLIVFHEASSIFKIIGKAAEQLSGTVDKIRELGLFDFVITDVLSDYKDIGRDKGLAKILMDSNGVCIGNTYDNQMYIDINSRDIRIKDALAENMGYIVENGKAYYSQVLVNTEVEEEEDEI